MNVTREVILDLLPVYLAGEASADTRKLVDEYLKQDVELGREIRQKMVENLAAVAAPAVPPELELKTLRRTRRLLSKQRWLFGMAILFTLMPGLTILRFSAGRRPDVQVLSRDYPWLALFSLLVGIVLWVAYYFTRRRSDSIL